MIEAQGLTKYYGNKPAILDVTFRVEQGEVVGFLGPNAAGKTTTMRILTGFFPANAGTARIAGFDTFTESLEVRKRVGYLPESIPLYREMRTHQYLDFVAEVKGVSGRERRKAVGKVVEECGLRGVERKLIRTLSRGYRQRVGLAQALIHEPEVLVLDEPTIGLDPKQIVEIRQLIKELGEKRTIILSTHILPEVDVTCSRVIIIHNGRIIAQETPENLTQQLQEYIEIEMEIEGPSDKIRETLSNVEGVNRVTVKDAGDTGRAMYLVNASKEKDIRYELSRAVFENNWGLLEFHTLTPSLEDAFVKMVTQHESPEELSSFS